MALRFFSVFLLLLTVGCQAGGAPVWQVALDSSRAEALAGLRAASSLEACHGGIDQNPAAEARMERIAAQISRVVPGPSQSYRCRLLACKKINAYSLPGGLVYITRGLYDRIPDEDTLAGVIAHEIAHIVAKDSFKPKCRNCQEKLRREVCADSRAAKYLALAGYRVSGMVSAIRAVEPFMREGWAEARIAAISSVDEASPDALVLAGRAD